jgi:predicted Zn-ribbon and HTH transcriptional regulator
MNHTGPPEYTVHPEDSGVEILETPDKTQNNTPQKQQLSTDTEKESTTETFTPVAVESIIVYCDECGFKSENTQVSVCPGDVCPECKSGWLEKS